MKPRKVLIMIETYTSIPLPDLKALKGDVLTPRFRSLAYFSVDQVNVSVVKPEKGDKK